MKNKKVVIIIPARYKSSRFEGKVLVDILGKSMIQRVYERASMSKYASDVIVATDDKRVKQHIIEFGGKAIMTSSKCNTGTDRVAEAAKKIDADIIVNVQGDEPLIDPKAIDKTIEPLLKDKSIIVTNAITKIDDPNEITNVNNVKVVVDKNMNIMYFSRSPIPGSKKGLISQTYKQIGLYSFRKEFLMKFGKMKQTPLELQEEVELMRILENGFKIRAVVVDSKPIDINVPSDIEKIERYMKDKNIE